MSGRIGVLARTLTLYLAVVVGMATLGALIGHLVLGQWFLGALAAGCLAALFALPSVKTQTSWHVDRPFNGPDPPWSPHDSDRD